MVTINDYDYISVFYEGLAKVRLNNKYGFIDKTDKVVIPIIYDDAYNFSEGLARVELDGKWGYIDKTGKEVIPIIYDNVWSFKEGLARVKLNGKWGYIDEVGKVIIPCIYDYVCGFSKGLAQVKLNDKYFYINKKGQNSPIPNFKYSKIDIEGSEGKLFKVGIEKEFGMFSWGFCDKKGELKIQMKYFSVSNFKDGKAKVKLYNFSEPYYIDEKGEEIYEVRVASKPNPVVSI
jgi:hypothetical protein